MQAQVDWRYFESFQEEILYDNIRPFQRSVRGLAPVGRRKQVTVKRLLRQSDSTLNSQFEDFAGFYGFKPILCRPYQGQTKGKVERTIAYVKDNFMVGIKYESLDHIFIQEAKAKRSCAAESQIQMSGLPFRKTIETFDFSFQPSIDKSQIDELCTLRFVANKENLVFSGTLGVDKTHLTVAVGILAVQNRYSTYYINCHNPY